MMDRTKHAACCGRCQGRNFYHDESGMVLCDHAFPTDVTGPDELEVRVAQLEDTISRMHAATDEAVAKARDAALEEAARVAVDPEDGLSNEALSHASNIAYRIRALKAKP